MQKAAASWATGGLELVRASGGGDAGDVGAGDDGARDGDVDDDGAGDVGDIGLEGLDLEETRDQHDHAMGPAPQTEACVIVSPGAGSMQSALPRAARGSQDMCVGATTT